MRRVGFIAVPVVLAAACGGADPAPVAPPVPYVEGVSLGRYDDGSGRTGVATLVTIRDAQAKGPDGAWSLQLQHGGAAVGGSVAYPASATWAAAVWQDVAPSAGTTYEVRGSDGIQLLAASATLAAGAGLVPPTPVLSLDGARIEWPAVTGATVYGCTLLAGGSVASHGVSLATSCDVSALPVGGYAGSVEAMGADPTALAAVASPGMPPSFDLSEARFGLLRRSAKSSLVLRAAGGRIDYGLVPGLAIWVGLSAPDGTADGGVWSIEVTGPRLPAANPLRFDLLANFTRRMVWVYGLAPDPGLYTATASSGAESVTTRFSVAPPGPLALPTGVAATGKADGSARFTWDPVAGASSYFAAAWLGNTFVAGQWVGAPAADFPAHTFTSGVVYDVYVTATDVDMSGSTPPTRVSASENSYSPGSFTAP